MSIISTWNKDRFIMQEIAVPITKRIADRIESNKSYINKINIFRATIPAYWPKWKKELKELFDDGKIKCYSTYFCDENLTFEEQYKISALMMDDGDMKKCIMLDASDFITKKSEDLLVEFVKNNNNTNAINLSCSLMNEFLLTAAYHIQQQLTAWFDDEYPTVINDEDH